MAVSFACYSCSGFAAVKGGGLAAAAQLLLGGSGSALGIAANIRDSYLANSEFHLLCDKCQLLHLLEEPDAAPLRL